MTLSIYFDIFFTPLLSALDLQSLLGSNYGADLVLVPKWKLRSLFAPRPTQDAQHSHLLERD